MFSFLGASLLFHAFIVSCSVFLHVAPTHDDLEGSRQTMLFGRSILGQRARPRSVVMAQARSLQQNPDDSYVTGKPSQASTSAGANTKAGGTGMLPLFVFFLKARLSNDTVLLCSLIGVTGIGGLRVFCRVRPLNRLEMERGEFSPAVEMPDETTVRVQSSPTVEPMHFAVDSTFDYNVTQDVEKSYQLAFFAGAVLCLVVVFLFFSCSLSRHRWMTSSSGC